MKTGLLIIGRKVLIVWGVFSLLVVLALVVINFSGSRNSIDTASPRDVRFVLNWCELGEDRIERVIHSYESGSSGPGDYFDAYAIRISRIELTELTSPAGESRRGWFRGDQLPKVVDDAVEVVGSFAYRLPWFPTQAELRSADFYVYPWAVQYHGLRPTAVQLIFVRPADRMVFYLGCKT